MRTRRTRRRTASSTSAPELEELGALRQVVLRARNSRRNVIGVTEQDQGSRYRGPTVPPPKPGSLNSALARNIEALEERRRSEAAAASLQDRIAERVTRFTGSLTFVYVHLILYGFWIVANLGWVPGVAPWDETFVVLAMVASVEAIFLSTFVLITQNRMAAAAEKRAELDLQISLLAEHEITKVVTMVDAIANHLGVRHDVQGEVDELKRNVAPEAVLDAIDSTEEKGRERRAEPSATGKASPT